jgi:hypothetical protein
MASNQKTNRLVQQTGDQTLIDGLKKHQSSLSSLLIAGTSFNTADLISTLQARIDARNATVKSRAAWQTDVKADRDERAKTKALISGLQQSLHVMFAGSIDTLADFGLKPRKVRVLTPEEKAMATAKAKATRSARHTMGSKQKAKIKGTAPQAAPATPPSPAAAPLAPKQVDTVATGPTPAGTPRQS